MFLENKKIFFVLSFENNAKRTGKTGCFRLKVEIKNYNAVIKGQNFFNPPVKNDLRTYGNIWKTTNGQVDDYITGCLLDHLYLKKY